MDEEPDISYWYYDENDDYEDQPEESSSGILGWFRKLSYRGAHR